MIASRLSAWCVSCFVGALALTTFAGCGSDTDAGGPSADAGRPGAGGSGASSAGSAGTPGSGGAGTPGSGSTAGGAGSTDGAAGASNGGSAGALDANGGAPSGPSSSRQVTRPVGTFTGTSSGFWEYVPPHYGNGAFFPLLVFWHGIGENGDGSQDALQKVTANGPPRLIKADQWPEDRQFVVLSPQHPGTDCPSSMEIDSFIQFAIAHYDVDFKRVYLTGLSCGAIGSWAYLGDHIDDVVAAAVLVSGDGRSAFAKAGCALGRLPIWALHGEQDPTVDPQGSIQTLTELQACTNPAAVDAKLTVYPGVQHDAWTRTYDLSAGNDVYGWLLSHRHP